MPLALASSLLAAPEPPDVRCSVTSVVSCLKTLSQGHPGRHSPSGRPGGHSPSGRPGEHSPQGRPGGYSRRPDPYVVVPCPTESQFCVTTLIAVPRASTREVARMAQALLEMPLPVPRTRPWPKSFVGLRTYLWLEPDLWRVYRAGAAVEGQRVELTGRPLRIRWDLGDGQEECTGPSGPYGPCSHVWTRSSPVPYAVTATVEYEISWRCAGPGCDAASGVLEPLEVSGRTELLVHEVQTRAHGTG